MNKQHQEDHSQRDGLSGANDNEGGSDYSTIPKKRGRPRHNYNVQVRGELRPPEEIYPRLARLLLDIWAEDARLAAAGESTLLERVRRAQKQEGQDD